MGIEVAKLAAKVRNLKAEIQQRASPAEGVRSVQAVPAAALIGVLVMAISLAWLPWVERTWRATGDEPHYLLAAHSLVTDLDFDLANNYDQLDYLAFYFSPDITRQIRINSAGQEILAQQLGLPVLIAPAYAVAGWLGVLTFQVILGGLLAALTFQLAFSISQDEIASLLATLFVSLSPPLFLYQYLVYPELIGALLTTLLLYYVVNRQPITFSAALATLLSLATLPWLNRRFIPLAILLALLIGWTWLTEARRSEGKQQRTETEKLPPSHPPTLPLSRSSILPTSLTLIVTLLSIAFLVWFNSRLSVPERVDFTVPTLTSIWLRAARGIGWLMDQQRGLFIYGPIYIFALWGLPILIHDGLRRRNPHWLVILPFFLSLGVTAVAGGFWVAWELGPRFLVVALPALAPALALAWRNYSRSMLGAGLALLLFGLSLSHSLILLQNSELPYKSSLPLFYSDKLGFALTEYLPDLADYLDISPEETDANKAPVINQAGEKVWFVEKGRSLPIVQSNPLTELPFGHYRLTWPIQVEAGLPPATELIRLSVKLFGGGQVFNKIITAADLSGEGLIELAFLNPNVDRWRTPMLLSATSSGQSHIWAKPISLAPDPFYAWFLPYLYLALLTAGAWLTWRGVSGQPQVVAALRLPYLFNPPQVIMGSFLVGLPVVMFGYLIYEYQQPSHIYEASELNHFVGQATADSQAADGQAWFVDPRVDPPQKAVYGPFDFYDPGRYQVAFRLKLPEPVETEQELARLQVNATANFDELVTQPLRREHFAKPDLYHDFVLTVNNPRRQALSFEVYYLGVAPLLIDQVTITKVAK